jgi:tetratricopeptide (TPR) repeat protein
MAATGKLCAVCGIAFLAQAWQPDAAALVPLYRQVVAEREKQFGPAHPKVARSASDLGLLLRNQGERRAAEPWLRRALDIDERALGPDSPLVAEDLENLASVLPEEQALTLYRRAAEHADPVIAARNLARLAAFEETRGNRAAALALYRQALTKEESAHANHSRLAVRLTDVAFLVEPKDAKPLLRRALAIQEKTLGAQHPETATTLGNLVSVLLTTGEVAEAEPLARRALEIVERALPANHPRIATSATNLAHVLRLKKDYNGARRLYERAVAIDQTVYGPKDPRVVADKRNLAGLLEEMVRRGITANQ